MYIVSGFRRTGTSAMMRAIAHSVPLVLAYNDRIGGCEGAYNPNPNGLYEIGGVTAERLRRLNSDPKVLVKLFFDSLPLIPAGRHKVVFMTRDPQEIKMSCDRVDEHLRSIDPHKFGKPYPPNVKLMDRYRPYDQADIDHVLGIMSRRADVDLIQVDFSEMIQDPIKAMARVQGLIPDLVPVHAARFIDPSLYRVRKNDEYGTGRSGGLSTQTEAKAGRSVRRQGEGRKGHKKGPRATEAEA